MLFRSGGPLEATELRNDGNSAEGPFAPEAMIGTPVTMQFALDGTGVTCRINGTTFVLDPVAQLSRGAVTATVFAERTRIRIRYALLYDYAN